MGFLSREIKSEIEDDESCSEDVKGREELGEFNCDWFPDDKGHSKVEDKVWFKLDGDD